MKKIMVILCRWSRRRKPEKTAFINKYGFLHINGKLVEHLGVQFGKDKGRKVPVTIEFIEDGFIVKKA